MKSSPERKLSKTHEVMSAAPLRVLIADDHAVVRRGVREVLRESFPTAVFGEAADAAQALELARQEPWDIVLLDIAMPGRSGLEALADLTEIRNGKMRILVLSMHHEHHYAVRVLKNGAAGYVTKDKAPEQLVSAVSRVLDGGTYVSPELGAALAEYLASPDSGPLHNNLSERELQVLCMLAKARTLKEIADELCLSTKTISTYHVSLLDKMQMTRDAELVRYALEHKLID